MDEQASITRAQNSLAAALREQGADASTADAIVKSGAFEVVRHRNGDEDVLMRFTGRQALLSDAASIMALVDHLATDVHVEAARKKGKAAAASQKKSLEPDPLAFR
jgi:hypothetical protein